MGVVGVVGVCGLGGAGGGHVVVGGLFGVFVAGWGRRGLGFDKPDREDSKKGNCASDAPAEVYGHTGFTGTCAWVDPVNELVYVFLSNRIYPDVTNRKLNQLHIRERIQGAIYDAMKKK